MNHIKREMERIGCDIRIETPDGWREGRCVLYPLRFRQKEWGSVEHTGEGRSEAERYLMFCPNALLDGSGYGSELVQGNDRFLLVWKDRYDCRWGSYTKACLRRMSEEQEHE